MIAADSIAPDSKPSAGLETPGRKLVGLAFAMSFIQLVFLLGSAGTLYWLNAWVYWGSVFVFQCIAITALVRHNPELVNERGKAFKKDTKFFDRILLRLYLPLSLTGLVLAGVDFGRVEYSEIPFGVSMVALAAMFVFGTFAWWAMYTNPHFESTVRIQTDRAHRVISGGPYRFMRHPGYFGSVTATLLLPIVLGAWLSYWAAIPAALIMIVRTALEDRVLLRELDGYGEYAKRVRYRLFPGIW